MKIIKEENRVIFQGVETEDVVVELRDFLQIISKETLFVDCTECEDLHTAIIQIIGAYKILYEVKFNFKEEKSAYKWALENFSLCENDSN